MKKRQAPPAKQPRQMSLVEALGLVDGSKQKPTKPNRPLPGGQRKLDSLGKTIKRDPNEDPRDVVARNLAVLEAYARSCEEGGGTDEEGARVALRALSCVRGVDSTLIASTGAGVALRAFRKSPFVSAQLAVQADKILEAWKELVTSEFRAKKKYRAHVAQAAAAADSSVAP